MSNIHECAIPMCGAEETSAKLIPCCENGHWIHDSCLEYIRESGLICPLCRSKVLKSMRQSGSLPIECLSRTPISQFGAVVAVNIGKLEYEREKRKCLYGSFNIL